MAFCVSRVNMIESSLPDTCIVRYVLLIQEVIVHIICVSLSTMWSKVNLSVIHRPQYHLGWLSMQEKTL